jgi:2-hydroxychromene-2-carboxylate isomerase
MAARPGLCALVLALAVGVAAARPGQSIAVAHPPPQPTTGPSEAPVTIELYFVPGAEPSLAAYRLVRALAARHPRRVRAIYRPRAIGARAGVAAIALAAHRAGRFFALLDRLAAHSPPPSDAGALAIAAELGLSPTQLARAAVDPELAAQLATNEADAFRAPINDSLELIVNGVPLRTAPYRLTARGLTAEQLEQVYQVALARARRAAAAGLTPTALAARARRALFCGDDEPDGGAAPDAWTLGALVEAGTGCPEPRLPTGRGDEPREEFLAGQPTLAVGPLPLAGAPSLGPTDAALTIAVACDLLGRGCRQQLATLRPLIRYYPGRVRLVWLPWVADAVVDTSYGREGLARAAAALCAADAGDGWPFADDPVMLQREPPEVAELTAEAGARPDAVAACQAVGELRVRGLIARVRAAGVVAGPTVIIAGRLYRDGFVDAHAAAVAVEHALRPGLFEALAP